MLTVSDLCIEFDSPDGMKEVVRNANLKIKGKEIVAVVGESGAGKSTIGNAIAGMIAPPGKITAGDIKFNGTFLGRLSDKEYEDIRGNEIACIFQNPMTALNPLETVGRQIIETPMAKLALTRQDATVKAKSLLSQVGFDDPERIMSSYPHELSGGMLQRAVIAIALSCDPSLLIADEPTTALDVSLRSEIVSLLSKIAEEKGIGVLLITHDMGVVCEAAHRIYIMRRGEIVEQGNADDILAAPQHAYTRNLIKSVPTNTGKNNRMYEPEPSEQSEENFLSLFRTAGSGKPLKPVKKAPEFGVCVKDLSVSFSLSRGLSGISSKKMFNALNSVSFDIPQGCVFGVVGGSGSGKTTLARVIAGLQAPTTGQVDFSKFHRTADAAKHHHERSSVQMVFQNPYASLNPRHTVLRQLTEAPINVRKMQHDEAEERARKLIEAVGLSAQDLKKHPHAFSGGQLQRISIARALSMEPTLLICDEPTSALDVTVQASVLNLLKDLNEKLGLTIVFISHDLPVCRHMCDHIIVMNNGAICEQGDALKILDAPQHPFTQHLIDSAPTFKPPGLNKDQLYSNTAP
ncbi:MAG: ABC transporter ATP-binding protein [Pseudomonadota bacterium]